MKCRYREKIYDCGNYREVDIFPVFKKANGRRRGKYKPTSAMQTRLNQRNAERELTRILNANFTEDDISVTLTYRDEYLPETYEDAERDVDNFIRRLKYRRKKLGLPELKYVLIPGAGRFHFHIPMNGGVDVKTLKKLWPYGYLNTINFEFDENGIEGHAVYISTQFIDDQYAGEDLLSLLDINEETGEVTDMNRLRRKGKRRYTCSRNIVRPEPIERDGRISASKAEELATVDSESRAVFEKLYPGYTFSQCKPYYNQDNGGYYLRVKMYRSDLKLKRPRANHRCKMKN